jgi:hypothetical protein
MSEEGKVIAAKVEELYHLCAGLTMAEFGATMNALIAVWLKERVEPEDHKLFYDVLFDISKRRYMPEVGAAALRYIKRNVN